MLDHAKNLWKHAVQVLAQLIKEKDELEKEIALLEKARVEVLKAVEGALDLSFGNKMRHIRRTFDAGIFSSAGAGKVIFRERSGREIPVA